MGISGIVRLLLLLLLLLLMGNMSNPISLRRSTVGEMVLRVRRPDKCGHDSVREYRTSNCSQPSLCIKEY